MEKIHIIYLFHSILLLSSKTSKTSAFLACKAGTRTGSSWLGRCNYVSEGQVNHIFDSPSLDLIVPSSEYQLSNNGTLIADEQGIKNELAFRNAVSVSLMFPFMTLLPSKSEAVDFLFGLDAGQQISNLWSPVSKLVIDQEHFLISVLTEASRFMIDLSSFLTTEKIILRLAGIISRFVNIELGVSVSSNHLTQSPVEEIIFQAAMLGISITLLSRTAFPLLLSSEFATTLSFQDLVLYASLFRPVGVSLLQFRTLLSMEVLEWVELGPNMTLPTGSSDASAINNVVDQYIYWLYNGDTKIILQWSNTVVHYNLKRRRGKPIVRPNSIAGQSNESSDESQINNIIDLNNIGLIADMNFVEILEERQRSTAETCIPKRRRRLDKDQDRSETWHPMPLIQSGSTGALLLRIDGKKLVSLMDDDDKLDLSIRTLLLQCSGSNLVTLLQIK